MNNDTYSTDNLSFAASVLLLERQVTIKRVTFHQTKPGVKIFHLSPKEVVRKLYLDYVSDKLLVSPPKFEFKNFNSPTYSGGGLRV